MLALVTAGAAGCSRETPAPDAERALVAATSADFAGVNELLGSSKFSQEIRSQLFLRLLQEQPDFQDHPPTFAPALATSYEWSKDHRLLTFHLRPEVLWSDGTRVNAEDVRWTWQAQVDPEVAWPYSYIKEKIQDVVVLDDHTVRFVFAEAYRTQLLDANEGFILPSHAWGKLPFREWRNRAGWFRDHLVVDGPFTLSRWDPQQQIVLERNERYHQAGKTQLDRVVLRIVPDQANQIAQLKAGSVDLVQDVPASAADELEADPRIRLLAFDSGQYNFICWNTLNPLLSKADVRRALTAAIDRQALVDALWHGYAKVASSPITSSVWAHHRGLTPWPYEPERARETLAARGWRDWDGDEVLEDDSGRPFSFELTTNTGNRTRLDAAVMIQSQLRRVGVEVRVRTVELHTLIALNEAHDFDASMGAWGMDTSLDLRYAFHSTEIEDGSNYGSYSDPEVDRLLDALRVELDLDAAKAQLDRLQEILHRDQPYTFLWEPQRLLAMRRRVAGAQPNALSTFFHLEQWRLARE